ncbi:MAG: hypothetical protein ACJ8F7_19685 [Gemmataceae bacterium]
MAARTNDVYAGISSAAVRAKTGKGWDEWFKLLDGVGAAEWPHKPIAAYLQDDCSCPPWWSQMVTVGFEQARGLRVKHQTTDGFSASGSKTVAVPIGQLYLAWKDGKRRAKWLPDSAAITIHRATKDRSMRITWADGSSVDVMFYVKGQAKSQVTVEQRKLPDAKAVARVKAFWKAALEKLKGALEAAPAKRPAKAPAPAAKKK